SKVNDRLYISGGYVSEKLEILKKNGITHIINASDSYQNVYEGQFEYLKLDLKDNVNEKISDIFEKTIDFIERAMENDGVVLIHCNKGISRSTCLCCLWIMKKERCCLKKALDMVKIARPVSEPNPGFEACLLEW
ncbi:hypothetical protein DICPUDRAFT_12401, partial [Dictyostelium purpureum]